VMLRHPTPLLAPAAALAELVHADRAVPEQLDPALRRVLASRLVTKAPARHLGTLRLDSHTILEGPSDTTGFQWSPRRARRQLGAAALRRVVEGTSPSPLSAVRAELDEIARRAEREHTRPGSLGTWIAESPAGVRASVLAEATTWATELLVHLGPLVTAGPILVGRADPVWAVPGAPWISLRGRRDAELALDAELRTRALLCVRNGRPRTSSVDDLGLVGLIDALARPSAPMANRVIGLWPAVGRMVALELDADVMRRAARQVVEAVDLRRQSPRAAA
jgi:hypothetical protein